MKKNKHTSLLVVKIFSIIHTVVMFPFACVTLIRLFGGTSFDPMNVPDVIAYIFAIPFFIGILLRCLFIPYIFGAVLAVLYIVFFIKSDRSKRDIILFVILQLICILGYISLESAFEAAMSV